MNIFLSLTWQRVLIALLCFYCNNGFTQSSDTLKTKYTNETITRYGSYFLKRSERLNYKDLPNELSKSELSMVSFKQAKKNKTMSAVFRYLSLLSVLASTSMISKTLTGHSGNTIKMFCFRRVSDKNPGCQTILPPISKMIIVQGKQYPYV